MEKIIDINALKPHATGTARCLSCRHEWVAVAVIPLQWLECPSCSLLRGWLIGPIQEAGEHLTCECGCDLFHISRSGPYCPNCGGAAPD